MKLSLPIIAATSIIATSAFAQTAPSPDPASPSTTAPAERVAPTETAPSPSTDSAPAPSMEQSPSTDTTVTTPSADSASAGPTLSDDEAKEWINKVVYSSDEKNVGEISAIERDPQGQVKEIHADIGGFLGLGETRVRLMPAQFKFVGDRVILNMTGDEAGKLPKVEG